MYYLILFYLSVNRTVVFIQSIGLLGA